MVLLTPEQRREVHEAGDSPVKVEDPITRECYVLVKAAIYEKLRGQVEVEQVELKGRSSGLRELTSEADGNLDKVCRLPGCSSEAVVSCLR